MRFFIYYKFYLPSGLTIGICLLQLAFVSYNWVFPSFFVFEVRELKVLQP